MVKEIYSYNENPWYDKSAVQIFRIYTTNAIKSLNSTYRSLNRQRSVFPNESSLLKVLYLWIFEATKNGVQSGIKYMENLA